ncbi:MAG TPA: sugar phosphate isomerase/epimerase family protein [Clostridia bacterium]|nr:sugar phosphate isomerase/epimerase family protein [Clostridia bacterium]
MGIKDNDKFSSIVTSDPASWGLGTSSSLFSSLDEAVFKECMDAGIENMEVCLFGDWTQEPDEKVSKACADIKRKADNAGINIWSIHLPFGREWDISEPDSDKRKSAIDGQVRLLELAAVMEPKKAVIHGSFEPISDNERDARISACRDSLWAIGEAAATLGIELAIECLPRTCLGNSGEEMAELIRGNDKVGVCCDTNHMFKESPGNFIRRIGSRIVTLHISDFDGIDERHWMPGEGIVDWNDVIAALTEVGYVGPFTFELSHKNTDETYTPEKIAKCWEGLLRAYRA